MDCFIIPWVHEYRYDEVDKNSTGKARTVLRSDDILAAPKHFKGLFEGWEVLLRLVLELGSGQV